MDWHKGPPLTEFLANLSYEAIRPKDAPLRLVIHGSEVYDNVPGIGKTATALVESGRVKPEQTLVFEPLSAEREKPVTARVRSVQLTRGHIATPGIPIPWEDSSRRSRPGPAHRNWWSTTPAPGCAGR